MEDYRNRFDKIMSRDKCLYLTFQPISKADGVSKKVFAQKEALNNLGLETVMLYPIINDKHEYSFIYDERIFIENIRRKHLLSPFIYNTEFYNKIYNLIIEENITLLYIRYGLSASSSFLTFLEKCKSKKIVIFIEIATYPYDKELKRFRLLPAKLIENIYRKQLYKFVDRIITYSDFKSIYNIKTINISNSAPNNLPLKKNNKINKDQINLLLVANIAFWHGIDRIIEGLKNYYNNKHLYKVYLYIVGEANINPEAQKLKKMVKLYNLENYICFCGAKDGHELDSLFEKSNLAIGCLGCHRKKITKVKSLKNVEYAMRGIPFIYSEVNEDFDNQFYVKKMPAKDTAIDILELCNFLKSQEFKPYKIKETIQHLTWEYQMNIVVKDFLNLKYFHN